MPILKRKIEIASRKEINNAGQLIVLKTGICNVMPRATQPPLGRTECEGQTHCKIENDATTAAVIAESMVESDLLPIKDST